MKRIAMLLGITALVVGVTAPAIGITDGEPDNGEHPHVGQLLFFVPDAEDPRFNDLGAWFSCSGTLIADYAVLTAGHCTFGVGFDSASTITDGDPRADIDGDGVADNGTGGNDIWINFDEEPDFDILPASSTYGRDENGERYDDWSGILDLETNNWIRGTAHPHPDYNDLAFLLADVGVVVLGDDPGISSFGVLPPEGHLDQFKNRRRNETRFTAVGYGFNTGFPTFLGGDTRMKADMKLVSLQGTYGTPRGTSVLFSSNPGQGKGGTCFGDSGGPVFHGDTNTIVAVTSFGVTFNCVEPGGYHRIDQADDLAFISYFLGS